MNKIKKLAIVAILTIVPFQAFAGWYVSASSASGHGWGESNDYYLAVRIAMQNCDNYSFAGATCYITSSRWVD